MKTYRAPRHWLAETSLAAIFLVWSAGLASAQYAAPTVSTTIARATPWQDSIDAVGTLRAARGADLAAEVSGIVEWIGFDSGAQVVAGAPLLRLRANDDPAKLAEMQEAVSLAHITYDRDQKQFRAQAVSQATIDADASKLRGSEAQLAQLRALVEEKIVRAPFAGQLGLRQVDLGQYVSAGTTVVTLQALDPIYVDFYVPQQSVGGLTLGLTGEMTLDAFPGRVFPARVAAINPKLDPATRMVQARATLANPGHKLLPGMFATIKLATGAPRNFVTLPNAAIVYSPYGSSVFVVNAGPSPTVREVPVKTGAVRGDQVAVTEGLHDGDVVVSAGQVKLRPGAAIAINNSVAPTNSAAPHPGEE